MIASVSEDATCKLWSLKGDSAPFETLKGHTGMNVRAVATVSDEHDSLDLVATGGEDGAIKIWDIHQMKQRRQLISDKDGGAADTGIQFEVRIPLPNGEIPAIKEEAKPTKA